jgi:hypothetical protein
MKKHKVVKYRKTIVMEMDEKFVKKYGFENSYFRFERAINNMPKEGDEAEEIALKYLQKNNKLSPNYSLNRVIALNKIKIEADLIDYDNKIVYEVKCRKDYDAAKSSIKKKWATFEYDKPKSTYQDYTFKGVAVIRGKNGMEFAGVIDFKNEFKNHAKLDEEFKRYFERLQFYKKLKRSKNYDELGNYIRKTNREDVKVISK